MAPVVMPVSAVKLTAPPAAPVPWVSIVPKVMAPDAKTVTLPPLPAVPKVLMVEPVPSTSPPATLVKLVKSCVPYKPPTVPAGSKSYPAMMNRFPPLVLFKLIVEPVRSISPEAMMARSAPANSSEAPGAKVASTLSAYVPELTQVHVSPGWPPLGGVKMTSCPPPLKVNDCVKMNDEFCAMDCPAF